MSETAASQLRRILYLVPHLADGEEHPLEEVAARAGVTRECLLADLQSLVERYDAPGGFVDGVQVYLGHRGVSVHSSHFLRPMRLTMPELCALELGLAVLRAGSAPDEHAAIDRALARLRQVITRLPANERHESLRHAELTFAGSAEHLATVRGALRARRKVELRYRGSGATAPTTRVVRPYTLAFAAGTWYVIAYCERSDALRFFRLDRIEAASATGEGFEPPAFSLEAVLADPGRVFSGEESGTVTIRYSARIARWVAEREGRAPDADGTLTMEHPLADVHWAVRHALQYGPDAEVLAPREVRDAVTRRLGAIERAMA